MDNEVKPVIISVSPPRPKRIVNFSLVTVTGVLFLAILAYGFYPIVGLRWSRQPFLGVLIEQTLVFSDLQSTVEGAWDIRQEVDEFGYQIRSVNDFPINDHQDLSSWVSQAEFGQEVELAWRHIDPNIGSGTFQTTLTPFPRADLFSFLVVPYAIGLAYLVMGLWVFWLRRQEPAGRVFPLFAASIAIVLGGFFELSTTHQLTRLWTLALGTAGGALLGLGMVFPQPAQIVKRNPGLHWVPIGVGLILGLVSQFWIFDLTHPIAYVGWWKASYFYNGLGIVGFLATMGAVLRSAESPVVRQQIRTILIGALLAFLPIGLWFLVTAIFPNVRINIRWVIPSLVFFPIAITYSIMRYRWMRTDTVLVRGLSYALVAIISYLGYAFILAVASLIIGNRIAADNPLTVSVFVLILVAVFSPLRDSAQKWLNHLFSRSSGTYQDHLQRLRASLTQASDTHLISNQLREQLIQALGPDHLHIFIYNPINETYSSGSAERGPASELFFARNSDFVRFLSRSHSCIYVTPGDALPDDVGADKAKIEVLNSLVFAPMIGNDRLEGWFALGERRSGDPYRIDDLEFIESMASRAGIGLARAQIVSGLNRRVEQLEALSRLATAVTRPTNPEELYNLIFTQINQLIPTQDLCIATIDPLTEKLSYAFMMVENDRLFHQEGKPVPPDQGLIREITRQGVPLRVDNYQWECNSRNLGIDFPYRAWMGAPLTTEKGLLGAVGLGSTHTDITFTHQQLELLRSIADLSASAITRLQQVSFLDEQLQASKPDDQELADRLQELTILHKIDDAINNRQALGHIMAITLRACLDYTKAGAGMIALRDQDELRTFISLGYPDGFRPGDHQPVPKRMAVLKASMQRGEPTRYDDLSTQAQIQGLHPNSRSLLSIPIKFDDKPAGAILLEAVNPGVFSTPHMTFIRRVMDHASVAITCAKLETELIETRRIKSQLAASLSQSIKSPLLAIKDNTEILLSESLGEINADQHNGLHIIRSSVDQIAKHLLELARTRPRDPES